MNSVQDGNFSYGDSLLKMEIEHLRLELIRVQSILSELSKQPDNQHVMIYDAGEYRRILINEIIQVQSNSNYSIFNLDDGSKILTSKTLKYWETTLNHPDLVRIHNSSLINRNKIKLIDVENSEIILTGNITSRYSRMSKSELLNKLTR
ncbi:MAG: LytTR family transcriptional regulator DNA-binding domain-containing protein [Saprospiraceae bacterium]|nr:LytTR family transcriptional regulator DNA-binding domain-containing protein [Saprospiraceae bacterium]